MRYLIFIFLFFTLLVKGQEKYLICFKDKGPESASGLFKNSVDFDNVSRLLSERTIERRIKTLGEDYLLFEDIPINAQYVESLKSLGVEIVRELKWFNAVSARFSSELLDDIQNLDFINKIEKVKSFRQRKNKIQVTQPSGGLQKGSADNIYEYGLSSMEMEMSDVPAVHNLGISGEGVLIGMIDAGFNWKNHPALMDLDVVAEHDFVDGDDDTSSEPDGYHGSATLSLTGGFEDGQLVAPAFNASYILAKTEIVSSETRIEEDNFAAAVEWMEANGVEIINTSLGYSDFNSGEESYTYEDMDGKTALVTRAMEMAFARGVVTVTSAGNEGNDPWFYITAPADGANIIAVGAVNYDGNVTGFSSRGPTSDGRIKPEIVAYGSSNYLANGYSGGYGYKSGTSYSSPIVTGICAQLLSVYPHLTNRQIRQTILESGNNTTKPDNIKGYGILSAIKAVTFPNLYKLEDRYYVNKIFESGVNENNTPTLLVHKRGNDFIEVLDMESSDGLIHTAELIGYSEGDTINFSFEYNDVDNNLITEPSEGAYKFIYGSDIVIYNTDPTFNDIPEDYSIEQNFPNPFNPATTIIYKLPEAANLKIRIYNVLGELVRTLVNNTISEGEYSIRWGGTDDKGVKVSSGVYIYTMETSEYYTSKKMVLLK